MTTPDPGIEPFTADLLSNQGYLYTTNAQLSSRMATGRATRATLEVADLEGRRVIDIGCGDGTFTIDLAGMAGPAGMHGVDSSEAAIKVCRDKAATGVTYAVGSAYDLPYRDGAYDVAYLRGVLHHMDRPADAVREALRVAPVVVVVEPNGYNPVLKVLERCSTYHREHGEKSYAPRTLDRWAEAAGGRVEARRWAGLVPMFCPDWLARMAKAMEPVGERVPVVRHVGCAVYVMRAERT